MKLSRKQIHILGFLACFGASIGVAADLFSGWSSGVEPMASAISLDMDSVKSLFIDKQRWAFVLGNYLAIAFLPFHMLGFVLVHQAIIPAGKRKALAFLAGAFYFVAVGTGYHGTFAFIGDTIQSGDVGLLAKMASYWTVWGNALVVGYALLCLYLIGLILSGKTLYARWMVFVTPPAFLILGAIAILLLPPVFSGVKLFIAVTGLNLPLLVFYGITWRLLTDSRRLSYE